ncbi:MAG: DNA mismatch repair protein MutS, partial [Flavobacteriales bacterium]|nr:DNA mismatch repair protein MutS [Flavobacteriales bacterium]
MPVADQQTIQDLEFDTIREWLGNLCNGDTAREKAQKLHPYSQVKQLRSELEKLQELHSIKTEGHTFPRIDFEELKAEIKLLEIKGSVLQELGFQNIVLASRLVNDLIYFFNKQEEVYPRLSNLLDSVYFTKELINPIEKVFDAKGQVKDDASPKLMSIRKEIVTLRRQIARVFNKEMKRFIDKGYLSDTKEAYLQNRRVLAVQSTHKRKIPGSVQGHSKTGNLTYIEPQAVVSMNHELEMVYDDERTEIRRILSFLTDEIRSSLPLIKSYQKILCQFDLINAKARLAIELDCSMPSFETHQELELIKAYHPMLWQKNKAEGKKTFPQTLRLSQDQRLLVISGPNAGGKSITLKTAGLLQLMFQSGLMIPADQNSRMCFFEHILTDIGDNQSIENQLSTYSYRLKRMKYFLDTAGKKSFLLLDEFGTGSDPELGGALAEVFFEELYGRGSYGVITTHYSNIKLKAASLKEAVNGSMLFDKDSLAPLFRLDVGQPGSSFTFEVASINGINAKLIASAKKRLDQNKV